MRRSLLASIPVGVAVAIGMRGAPGYDSSLLLIAVLVLFPLFFVILAVSAVAILQEIKEMPKSCRFLMNAWLLVFCAIIVAIFVGQKVQSDQISEVEKYVLRAAPVLDDIKMRQGKFPRELPVDVIGKPPYFIGAGSKPGEGYYSDGDNFEFAYEHPSSDTHIRFNSKERSWIASKASRIFR